MVMSPVTLLIASMAILQENNKNTSPRHEHPSHHLLTSHDPGASSAKSSSSVLSASFFSRPPSASASASASASSAVTRRDFGWKSAVSASTALASLVVLLENDSSTAAHAFDGSGASASSGYNPATKAEKVRGYKKRIVADVRDFNRLGDSLAKGEPVGEGSQAWVNFFITFQRREADEYGRTYAALVDFRGLPTKKKYEYEGGDGLLLATSFTKPGKPSENTPAVKSWNKLFKSFDEIEQAAAGAGTSKSKKGGGTAAAGGDVAKARAAWEKTKPLLEQYLADVELPGDLSDPMYN